MKITSFKEQRFYCISCGNERNITDRTYRANPFCSHCYEERLIDSSSIDLRENQKVIQVCPGYSQIVPMDKEKKWRKKN